MLRVLFAMKPLKDLCTPRASVFGIAWRETVLNLSSEPVLKIGLHAVLILVLVHRPRFSGLFLKTRTRDEDENEDPRQFQNRLLARLYPFIAHGTTGLQNDAPSSS